LMEVFGYTPIDTDARAPSLVRAWLSGPAALARAGVANHDRIGDLPEYLARRSGLQRISRSRAP